MLAAPVQVSNWAPVETAGPSSHSETIWRDTGAIKGDVEPFPCFYCAPGYAHTDSHSQAQIIDIMPHFLSVKESGKKPSRTHYTAQGRKLFSERAGAILTAACEVGLPVGIHGSEARDVTLAANDLSRSPIDVPVTWLSPQSHSYGPTRLQPTVQLVWPKNRSPKEGTLVFVHFVPANFARAGFTRESVLMQDATISVAAALSFPSAASGSPISTYYTRRFWNLASPPDGGGVTRGIAVFTAARYEAEQGRLLSDRELHLYCPAAFGIVASYERRGLLEKFAAGVGEPLVGSKLQAAKLAMLAGAQDTRQYFTSERILPYKPRSNP